MAIIKNSLSHEYIKGLDKEGWEKFRHESWRKKQEYYSREVPEWYLKDRESYAQFVERMQKRRNFKKNTPKQPVYEQKGALTRKVEILAGDDVDSFADDK